MKRCLFILIAFMFFVAQAQSPLELNLERFLITEMLEDGETVEVLEPALALEPGHTIQERLTAINVGKDGLNQLALVVPVPAGTRYLAETASPLAIAGQKVMPQFSHDGGETYAFPPLIETITVIEDGVEVQQDVEVLPEAYTHVRWVVPALATEAEVTATFRAMVR